MSYSTGQVQGCCMYIGGAATGFARAVTGGGYDWVTNPIVKNGIGGQRHVRKGTSSLTLNVDCVGIPKDTLALFFPTAAGVQIANFPDLLVDGGDDQFILYGVQPVSMGMTLAQGDDTEVEYSAQFMAAGYTATTGKTCLYADETANTINDVTLTVGAATVYGLSFNLSDSLNTKNVNLLDGKTAGSRTFASAVIPLTQDISFSMTTAVPLAGTLADDCYTDVDIVITMTDCASGTTTVTLVNMNVTTLNTPLEAEDLVAYASEFIVGDGTMFNRIQVA